jgi:LacI family transcriptional regulator
VLSAGLRVPEDVAIIGCGNYPLGATLRNPVSTIDQNTRELGEKSAAVVLSLLQKHSGKTLNRATIVEPHLLVRASSSRNGTASKPGPTKR